MKLSIKNYVILKYSRQILHIVKTAFGPPIVILCLSALHSFVLATSVPPESSDLEERWHSHIERGIKFEAVDRYLDAISEYSNAIRLSKIRPEPYRLRARVYYQLGQHQRVIKDATKAIALSSNHVATHLLRANAYYENGEFEKSIRDYSMVINSGDREYLFLALKFRGKSHYVLGSCDLAVVDLDASQLIKRTGKGFFESGLARYCAGKFANAVLDFSHSIRHSSKLELYAKIWIYLSESHILPDANRRFSDSVKLDDLSSWPGQIIEMFLGKHRPESLSIRDDLVPDGKTFQCESFFYIGKYFESKNNEEEAIRHYTLARQTKARNVLEYYAAIVELNKRERRP